MSRRVVIDGLTAEQFRAFKAQARAHGGEDKAARAVFGAGLKSMGTPKPKAKATPKPPADVFTDGDAGEVALG